METISINLYLSGLFTEKELQTLEQSKGFLSCEFCFRKLRCAKTKCGDILCVECLDNLFDSSNKVCPICKCELSFDEIVYL